MDNSRKKLNRIAFISLGLLCFSLFSIYFGTVNNDFYFLKATGDEIIKTGTIPDTNPFFVIKGKPLVIQQWLWCVLCSLIAPYGNIGIFIIQIVQLGAIAALLYAIMKSHVYQGQKTDFKVSGPEIFMLCMFSVYMSLHFIISIRPESITIILLLVQILGTEKYIDGKKPAWLILLPLTTLLEINIHASMWPFHFCVLVPYFLPFLRLQKRTSAKPFIIPMVLMVASLFVNPVGFKAVMFIFDSFLMGTFKTFETEEMRSFIAAMKIPYFFFVFLALDSFAYLVRRHELSATELYISTGLLFLIFKNLKNAMFFPILVFYFFPKMLRRLKPEIKDEKMKERINKFTGPALCGITAVSLISSCVIFGKACFSLKLTKDIYDTDILSWEAAGAEPVENIIFKESGLSAKILTEHGMGGYFQSKGYRNVYMDVRIESYAFPDTAVSGTESVLKEYSKICYNPIKSSDNYKFINLFGNKYLMYREMSPEDKDSLIETAVEKRDTYSDSEISHILDTYDFDYIVASDDWRLLRYLEKSDDYEQLYRQVLSEEYDYSYILFKRRR